MDGISTSVIAAATAALVAGAAYIDGHYNIRRDIRQLRGDKRFGERLQRRCQDLGGYASLYHHLEMTDQGVEGLWFEGRSWTYGQMKTEVDALAEILHRNGVGFGSFVAVFMTNSPEMVFTIIAIAKLGAVPALINIALRSQTLLHCLSVAGASTMVATPDLTVHLMDILDDPVMAKLCISLNVGSFNETSEPLARKPPSRFREIWQDNLITASRHITHTQAPRQLKDIACLIYTSGTTGKPKACSIKNMQFALVSTRVPLDSDNPKHYSTIRIYSCLPLFHGTCLFTALCYAMGTSGTFCLGRRFSASNFSKALVDSKATRMLYVGELCRYLLKAPPSPYDRAHNCTIAAGNGLSGDVWNKFMDRYGIEEIREFYRSTEGLAKFDNFGSGRISAGKVGFEGPIYHYFNEHTYLVRYDTEKEAPWRDPKTGFCAVTKPGQPGEAIARINNIETMSDYLNNDKANQEKIIRNVFKKGDQFQRTGDLLVRHRSGWIHFLDRSGDTYRWQSENVSAGEVREHIGHLVGVHDVTVFGTKLDGYDGQAGAAAITLSVPTLENEEAFAAKLYDALRLRGVTHYQMPRLLRFMHEIEVNATFKHAKTVLQARSWDPEKQVQGDSVWWLDGNVYRRLDKDSWASIKAAKARL
ncbi:bifunctional fatty acid transporter and acyl-CoA synthetase [Tothia fuscella]|uniref:Bifunctional fatty acid transporter and acyl-CoA synthetase n=1 Tax=Tothia fuscella TaxID=1048955 RepID=A0A9P4P237_9PEZI|nr:bifunctional fatty acid transporter and acyl-CoA synthetase [Tothia fuscella]